MCLTLPLINSLCNKQIFQDESFIMLFLLFDINNTAFMMQWQISHWTFQPILLPKVRIQKMERLSVICQVRVILLLFFCDRFYFPANRFLLLFCFFSVHFSSCLLLSAVLFALSCFHTDLFCFFWESYLASARQSLSSRWNSTFYASSFLSLSYCDLLCMPFILLFLWMFALYFSNSNHALIILA